MLECCTRFGKERIARHERELVNLDAAAAAASRLGMQNSPTDHTGPAALPEHETPAANPSLQLLVRHRHQLKRLSQVCG